MLDLIAIGLGLMFFGIIALAAVLWHEAETVRITPSDQPSTGEDP